MLFVLYSLFNTIISTPDTQLKLVGLGIVVLIIQLLLQTWMSQGLAIPLY